MYYCALSRLASSRLAALAARFSLRFLVAGFLVDFSLVSFAFDMMCTP